MIQLEISLMAYEKACLERALEVTEGDALKSAKLLGIGKSTMYRKLRKHRLLTGKQAALNRLGHMTMRGSFL